MTNSEVATMTSYGRRLTEIAAERPDDVDLIIVARDGTERGVDWRTLEARANQIAREFEARGISGDDIVALALPTCVEHILVTLAIWKLGATLLPLRSDLPAWEIERMLGLAEPALIVSDTYAGTRPTMTTAELAATTVNSAAPLPDRVSECVNLIASSGSTGRPKLIVVPARGVVGGDKHSSSTRDNVEMIALVASPLNHVNGFSYAAPTVLEGGRAIVMERFEAQLALDLIARHRATFTVMVPTMLQRIARLDDLTAEKVGTIQRLIYGGAKVPEWVVDRWLAVLEPHVFTFLYGSSERVGLVSMTGADWPAHRGSTGRPLDVELSIRDPDGREVATGEIGEIFMRPLAPRVMFRYIGADTPPPTEDGYYSIGDLGSVDEEGYLYVADRRSDMIITGGANVFPAEVEEALSGHPDVVDQVVVGVPDSEWGHRVHAIIQLRDGPHPPTPEELKEFSRARLAAYKIPKTWEFVDVVPRTEAGKLNRNALGEERASAGR
jgi:bile acid-coenzyme A ligase